MPIPGYANSPTQLLANSSNPARPEREGMTDSVLSRGTAIPGRLPSLPLATTSASTPARSFRAKREIPLRCSNPGTHCHPGRRRALSGCRSGRMMASSPILDSQSISPGRLSFRAIFTGHIPTLAIPCTMYRITTYSPNLALRCYHLPNRSAQHGILHCPGGLV